MCVREREREREREIRRIRNNIKYVRYNKKLFLKKYHVATAWLQNIAVVWLQNFLKITSQVMLLILWFDGIKLHIGSFTTPNTKALTNMVLSVNMVKL